MSTPPSSSLTVQPFEGGLTAAELLFFTRRSVQAKSDSRHGLHMPNDRVYVASPIE